MRPNLFNPTIQRVLIASSINNGGIIFVGNDALGLTQIIDGDVRQFNPDIFRNHLTTGENGDILQHCLATVTKTRSLDRGYAKGAAQLVDHQGSQGFTVHVLGDDHQRPAHLGDLLKDRQHVLHGADFLFVD